MQTKQLTKLTPQFSSIQKQCTQQAPKVTLTPSPSPTPPAFNQPPPPPPQQGMPAAAAPALNPLPPPPPPPQQVIVAAAAPAVTAAPPHRVADQGQSSTRFKIQVANNPSLVLDISGGSNDDGAKLIIWGPNGGDNQKFEVTNDTVLCVKSQKVLDCSGGLKKGRSIIQFTYHGRANQQWVYDQTTQVIKSKSQNLVLDVKGGNLTAGTEVIAWPPNNGANQKWDLIPV